MAQDYFDPARAVSIGGGNDDFDPGRAELIKPAGGTASDLAKSLKVGAQRLPGMVTGLADLPFSLAAGARPFTKAADALGEVTGFQPGKWADETKFSAGYEQGKKAVDDAWKDGSAGDIALAYLKNPGYTANQVVESAPGMVAGGLAGRALMGVGRVAAPAARAGGVGPAVPGLAERALGQWAAPVAAGVGEGAVTAGQQMAQYQGEDQQTNALASLGAGAVTGLVGVGAGRVANKLGLETAETAIAKAGTGAAKAADDVPLSAKRRILGGMVSEALLQELPQSAQEQMWQNWADGKPLMEGVARAATEGAIAGGVIGAGANVSDGGAGKRRALAEQQAKQLSEAEAEALRADPSRAWTTEAGAANPNQPAGERAAPPEAPELQTSPGAAGPRDGLDFTRDVDTAGLTMQDPAEVERARAATMDYEPTDATPQWDTQPGAAEPRAGLDMPAREFDTGALGFDPRPLSERMGLVPAANTPLTKAAALSVDTGASPVQFLGATGRDMQLRQTGPGVANESNVIDVQGRVVEDRAIGTPRQLTAQDGARESGAIAFQDGVPRSEIAAIPNIVARAEQLRGYDEAAQKAAQPLAIPAPSNPREGLERIRAQREQAARTAQVPPTTGAASVPQANQAQQAVSQQPQAGGQAIAGPTAPAAAQPAALGGSGVQAAGLTNGAPTQNPGAQAATAAGAQGQAPQTAVARPDGWRKSMLRAAPIARAMGIDTKGKRLAQVVAEIDARDTQTPTTPAPQPAPGPVRLGRDNRPLSEGGKPFKTRKAAGDAKKLQPMMRVVTVEGGYALAEKTPAQLAAEERASRRLRSPSTSAPGEPIPAHAFIAAAGGLNRAAAADLGVEGNPRIGNRTLFAGQGRGLSIEQATQMLIQDGYLSEGALHNDAYALIKTSLTRPQYNADGYERIAEAEAQTHFEDYLAAQEEAAADGNADPFGVADSFTAEELDGVGYTDADPALQAEVNALIVQADAMGIDTYAILDDIARTYADATQNEFNAKARDAIAAAIARGNQDGGSTAAQAAPAAEPAQEPGLTAPIRADIEAQQEARDKAEREEAARQRAADQAASQDENRKRIAQASVRAAAEFELGQDPLDSLTGQGSMFDDAPEQPQQAPTATEPVAQPITRADVTAAQQQAATLIAERIDAMTAGEVNTIARRFLPTMGVKPTISKERNKAAVTDFTKVNPLAAADEFGVKLPADVRRALDAEMQGKVADAWQDDGLAARADGDDDYLSTLFGGSDAGEQDAPSPAQTRKVDAKAAVPMLRALAQEKRVEAEDWSSRKYKGNKSQVNLRGDGPSNQETMSVSAVNESRRRKAIESLAAQANAADKLADRIESGSINIQSALDKISSAVDSDMKRDGGKPSIGKSRQDMFEGYISRQLLADPYAGYGEGTVSSALRAMYEWRVADGFVEPAAARPAAANDRNAFTLQRLNRDTDQMEPVTFERGEYVRYTVGSKDQFGDIDGISQARKEFSVDGLWYPFGFAYKAERPAAPKADTVPLSSVIDKVNAKNGQGLTDADRVPEQKPASKTPTVDRHNAAMAAVREGKATAEQFRASFEQVVSNKDAIVAELDTMTKAQLLRDGGPFVQMRYANEKKAAVVDAVYREMVGEYALGESVTYSMGRDSYQNAVRKLVEATDADKLAQYVKDRQDEIAEAQARGKARAAALENPQTLGDFREVLNAKIREGMTRKEAFLTLTPQQRIQYDTLEAESTREARENRKRAQKTEVRAAGQTTAGEIVATKHTRDGYDLFVVKLADRLSKEDYSTVLASAKKLGGWYSAFRGNGAIPGFQFKDKANAEAFLSLAGGDTAAAQEQVAQRRDAFEDDRSQTAVERLRAMADKLEEGASEVEGQERKTNTARRARFASAAMASAAADKAKAKTMRNIAQAIEDGNAKFLDAVRTKSQVDMLTGIVDTAKGNELRAKYPSYADQEKRKGEPPTAETADFAEFPSYSAFRSDLATLGRQMLEVDGTKKLGQRLMSVADDVTDAYLEFAKANFHDVSRFGRGDSLADFASKDEAERAIKRSGLTGKAIVLPIKRGQNRVILSPSEAIGRGLWQGDGDKRITLTAEFGAELVESIGRRGNKQNKLSVPWQFQNAYDRRKALSRIGIETPSEFRAALREFISLKEQAIANRTRELELQMVGRKADGLDFFPTSAEVADQMIEAADLTPDMAVLEPSAGMGHLADRIREAGAEPDVIEISADRRALLEEKGYTTQAVDDFLDLKPREFYTFGDTFRAPDGAEGIMRGANGNRVKLVNQTGDMVGAGYYDRADLTGVAHNGTASGYDRIIMNPPFSNRRDAEHVRHAYSLLKPGGRIVAIMGEGVFFGQDKKAQDFREWLESVGGTSEKLPEGSFMDPSLPVNTSVNARMVVIDKADGVAMFSRAIDTQAAIGTPAATIRAAITKAYGKLLGQLESKGLVTLTQTQEQAIEAAAQARADKTGKPLEEVRASLMGSVSNSVATDTPAFKRWFGDSKVVDADGKPLVVYHGSKADIIEFSSQFNRRGEPKKVQTGGLFFTPDRGLAQAYAGDGAVYPVYVRIANPMPYEVQNGGNAKGGGGYNRHADFPGGFDVNDPADVEKAERLGYDGILNGGNELIAFRPEQVKSAIGNNGNFDPNDLDIRRSANGAIQGFFDPQTGQSFLVADNLTAEAAPGVLMHEVGIHMAADGSMKALFNRAAMMLKLQRGNPFIKAVQARMDAAGETSGEEAAAYIAEAYENDRANAPASVQRWLSDLLAAVKAWMFKKGIMGADRLTVADIAAVARANARSMARDGGATGGQGFGPAFSRAPAGDQTQTEAFKRWFAGSKAVDAEGKPLRVYHGTGLDFTAFSADKLGSNTGAASAKRGFFFASNPKVSDFYAMMAFKDLAAAIKQEWDQVFQDKPAGGKWVGGYEGDFVLESDPAAGRAYKERVLKARSAFQKLGDQGEMYRKLNRRATDIAHEVLEDYGIHIVDAKDAGAKFLDDNPYFAKLMQEYAEVERARTDLMLELGHMNGANVMPVYLKISNPLEHDFEGERFRDVTYNQLIKQAQDEGRDGVILRNTFDTSDHPKDRPLTDVYVVFDPTQIKSALGNRGTFDPADPDIRFSRAGVSNTGGQAATGWDAPTPTGFDDVIYKLQDKNIDLKRVVESISKATGKVADSINAYLKEELFHKRAAKRVADFGDRELKPLMNKMRLAGLSMEDVEEYLHARHAKEANAVIAQRNPGNAGLQDGGSGMTNAAADNYFAKLDPAQRRKLEAVAKSVDAIIDGTRKLYVSYGLEDQAVVDGWASMYQHYIPLMREDKDGGMGTGQGFSVKGKETKGRTGSTRKVVDILANVAMQREKLIVRGEKNIVAQALVGLAQANPNPDFWEVRSQAPTERVFDPKTGVVVDRPDPLFKSRENVAVAKVKDANGKVTEQMVVFNEDNPRAVRMAAAMKNLDAGNLEGLLGVSAKITRYFAAINTQYNPVFGVVNLVRDVQGAMVNLGTTQLAGQQGKIAKDTLSALRGIYGDIRKTRKGGQATSQWSQLWEQMQDDGGTTGYRDLFKTSADRANDLKSILNPEGWMDSKWGKFFTADGRLKVPLSMAQKGATEIFGWLSDYNEAMENGVRLAAYKAALDKGMSREQAASLAKNLTVNFNRKGQAGMQAGAVYAFFNAAMQGTARIGQTLFDMDGGDLSTLRLSKTGKAVVYGGVMLGVMQALALSAAGFDDDDPPEFVRERSLIIPTGDKTYVSIPMPLGLHVIPGIGRHATEFALSGFDKPAKRAVSMVGMFADAFNPIGNAGLSMQTIAPTALDPLVALSENKDWTGKPIARVSSNKAMPGHTQWKDTATGFSKVVAEAINWVSGGNEYVAGAFSPTPDQIDYLIAQLGGGVAREAAKVQQTITTAMSGETLPTHKIPLVGRFVGNAASQASQGSAFYANLNKLNELETEIKGLRKDGRFDEAAKLTRENPQSILIAMANRAERDVQRLRREKRELIANDASREQVRAKEDQITDVMTRLNEAVERRKAQAAR